MAGGTPYTVRRALRHKMTMSCGRCATRIQLNDTLIPSLIPLHVSWSYYRVSYGGYGATEEAGRDSRIKLVYNSLRDQSSHHTHYLASSPIPIYGDVTSSPPDLPSLLPPPPSSLSSLSSLDAFFPDTNFHPVASHFHSFLLFIYPTLCERPIVEATYE